MKRWSLICAAFVLGLLGFGLSSNADARPGGGSYGGGGSSYSSSGSGGSSAAVDMALLFILGPILIFAPVVRAALEKKAPPWEIKPTSQRPKLHDIAKRDPNFSQVLLEDFLFELYSRVHAGRSDAETLARLSPYLTPNTRVALSRRGGRATKSVEGVVVGGMSIDHYIVKGSTDHIYVDYEANYTETIERDGPDKRVGFYVRERWAFTRATEAQSPSPAKTLAFNCPSCGAPVANDEEDKCTHCGETNWGGRYAWRCSSILLVEEKSRAPTLSEYVPEEDGPALNPPAGTQAKFENLLKKHHGGSAKVFNARVEAAYHGLNDAWSSLQWDDARAFLTDRLWLSWRYWIRAYSDQDLRNQMLEAKLERVEIARVDSDPFFDVVVVRIYASAIDITVHAITDSLVAGYRNRRRSYSEYWTLIRPTGRDGSQADGACPNCGAMLSVEMVGRCDACRVKVQRGGEFDWVLSKVEQDEAYRA